MTISDLFEELSNKDFQDPATGSLFFPAYIYTYNATQEYKIRREIENLKERLIRPDNYVDCLILNIYKEFISYLKGELFGQEVLFDLISNEEETEPGGMTALLKEKAGSLEFLKYINNKAQEHFNFPSKYKRVYLMIHGFGSIYPYLRTSEFLKKYEKFLSGEYKLITFFPGNYENKYYHLFSIFNDENIYRATLLNK
jgi:hypothetical protein